MEITTAVKEAGQLLAAGEFANAIELLEDGSLVPERHAEAQLLRARAYFRAGYVTRCESLCRELLDRGEYREQVLNFLCKSLAHQGRVHEANEISQILMDETGFRTDVHSRAIHWAHGDETLSAPQLLELSREFELRQGPAVIPRSYPNSADAKRRLRVGFISVEMRDHSKFFFTRSLFAALDRAHLQVYVYAGGKSPDAYTDRLRAVTDFWRDVHHLSDADLIQCIRKDKIDILVDLMGHVRQTRLRCLLYKPAPILVEYGEAPSGLSVFDYRISDEVADPPGMELQGATPLVRIPDGFHVYEPPADAPPITPPPAELSQRPVFCSLVISVKFNPPLLRAWSTILKAVPDALLLLKSRTFCDHQFVSNIHRRFAEQGVASERIRCFPHLPERNWHLRMYNQANVALDTFPYNGVTTTCEALWMGTPVVTYCGDYHTARRGASLLSSAGLPELIADSWDDYICKSVELVQNTHRLSELRGSLRDVFKRSPLCDSQRLAVSFEREFRAMWRKWCVDQQ